MEATLIPNFETVDNPSRLQEEKISLIESYNSAIRLRSWQEEMTGFPSLFMPPRVPDVVFEMLGGRVFCDGVMVGWVAPEPRKK
ncbi:MAG: hypothetical protein OXG15_07165 [Gammaproteobacteria bacterium]|nr:hypothetical protein [Gammaproteobacteria bacterium]